MIEIRNPLIMCSVFEGEHTVLVQGVNQTLERRQIEIFTGGSHIRYVIFSHLYRSIAHFIAHKQRAAIHVQDRSKFVNSRLENLVSIKRVSYRLRNAMCKRLTFSLLGQSFLRAAALSNIHADAGNKLGPFRVSHREFEDQPVM